MFPELFQILLPRMTPRVLEVIHRHLSDEQIGLLLVKLINPYVILSQQEEALLRGVNRKTLRQMKARGELPLVPVNAQREPMLPGSSREAAKSAHPRPGAPKPV